MLTKVCRVCGRRLPLSELVKDKRAGLGRASICKPCYRDLRKTYPSYTRTKKKKRKRKKTMTETYEPGEIKLNMRYPESRLEDVTDAYMRGFEVGLAMRTDENAKLRELVRWMYERMDESCAAQYPYAPTPISYDRLMQALARARELGVEVDE